jgi:hypothetical protein
MLDNAGPSGGTVRLLVTQDTLIKKKESYLTDC